MTQAPNAALVARIFQLMHDHLDAPLTVRELASRAGVSESVLKRVLGDRRQLAFRSAKALTSGAGAAHAAQSRAVGAGGYNGKLASMGLAYHYIYGQWRELAVERGYQMPDSPALILLDALPQAGEQRVVIAVPLDAKR